MKSLASCKMNYVPAKARFTKKGKLLVVVAEEYADGIFDWEVAEDGDSVFIKIEGDFTKLIEVINVEASVKWFTLQVRNDGKHLQVACAPVNRSYGFAMDINS